MPIPTSRCPECPGDKRCVAGDGPLDAEVVCIGEAPGREEDGGGQPFIGAAGREFNYLYLPLAGLRRGDVYVTNAKKCRPPQNKTPEYREMRVCADWFVPHELEAINPTYVILMGSTACKLLGEDAVDLEAEHGIPRWGALYGWEGWVIPINHPAAGLHDGAMMTPMLEDWERLERWFRTGVWQWAEDEGEKDYRLCRTENAIVDYFEPYTELCVWPWAGVDSESHNRVNWSMQFSVNPHTGIMVQTDDGEFDPDLLPVLSYYLHEREFAYHNADADVWVAEVLGLGVDHPHRDTQQESYQFQNLPQKLKALSRRLLGRDRVSWEELVTPCSKDMLHQWFGQCVTYAENHLTSVEQTHHKRTGKPNKPKIIRSDAEKILRELDGYMVNNPKYKVWDKIVERVDQRVLTMMCELFGPWPRLGIAHVPVDQAVWYGCSDADDTLRIALLMERMRGEFREGLGVRVEDRDR